MKVNYFSRIGFILAVSGSAIGLGNIWKFPYMVGEMGGSAFVLVYLLTVALIGISLLIAEMVIGNYSRSDSITSFEKISRNNKTAWKFVGFSSFSGLLILTFYSVVIGWIFYYIIKSLTQNLSVSLTTSEEMFSGFLQNDILSQMFFHLISVLLICAIVYKGIKKGIETTNLLMMPLLFIIFLGLLFYSISLPTFGKAWHFLFDYDFAKIDSNTLLMAVGHSFFTLSIGMGAILTYSASSAKETNIFKDAVLVAFLDTAIALIAGLVIFTFLFGFTDKAAKGPGLVFISLPTAFASMGAMGTLIAIFFFIALSFAAITSAISILEPSIKIATERYKIGRKKAIMIFGAIVYIIGLMALLSNSKDFSQILTFGSKNLFDWLDYLTTAILLPIGGIAISIFLGYFVPKEVLRNQLSRSMSTKVFDIWYFSIKFIAPIGVIFILLNESGLLG
mgnify:FL=1